MSLTFATTTRWALRKLVGSNLIADIDAGFSALADDIDSRLTPHTSGLASARPTSTVGTPGIAGRTYRATDTGAVYLDTGSGWLTLTLGIGEIRDWAGATAPESWLILDGAAISRTTYAALFALVGTTYGPGNGSTTFNLPNAAGRVTLGAGNSGTTGSTSHTLGQAGGEEKHVLSIGEMPAHQHQLIPDSDYYNYAYEGDAAGKGGLAGGRFASGIGGVPTPNSVAAGGDQAHNNLPPFVTVNKIIRAL